MLEIADNCEGSFAVGTIHSDKSCMIKIRAVFDMHLKEKRQRSKKKLFFGKNPVDKICIALEKFSELFSKNKKKTIGNNVRYPVNNYYSQ